MARRVAKTTPPLAYNMHKFGQFAGQAGGAPVAATNPPDLSLAQRERALMAGGWLGRASPELQRGILSICRWQSFAAGAAIQHAAATDADMFGIVHGVVQLSPGSGIVDIPSLHFLQPGQWFGMVPLISGEARRVSATARTTSVIARVPHEPMRMMLARRPEWWRDLACSLLELTDVATTGLTDLLIHDSARRCGAVLLRLSGCRVARSGNDHAVEVALTQAELAAMSNVSRNTLGGILRDLAERDMIEPGYRTITVRRPAALRAFVDGH